MKSIPDKEKMKKYYDQEARGYSQMYTEDYAEYPANLIRLNLLVERLKKINARTVLDVGCGTCAPMIRLLKEGFKVKGFDIAEEMVKEGKKELEKAGCDPQLISQADLDDESTVPDEKFDAIIALGVFPHLSDEVKALSAIEKRLSKSGTVFVEFRNDLFAAFTLNDYSLDFFLNRVLDLGSLPEEAGKDVVDFYSRRLKIIKPKKGIGGKLSYVDLSAKFRNPLNIEEQVFQPGGFSVNKIHFYHYHALPPVFEQKYPVLFRELSLKMENPGDWKGYLMASAYVVEAARKS